MSHLSLSVAIGVMTAIGNTVSTDFDAIGITPDDYKLTSGDAPWSKNDRRKVSITLEALMYGSLDQLGLARFAVPSEYVAAIIAAFVAPANRLVACMWLAEAGKTGARAMDLASQGLQAQTVDTTSPQKLFALVCQLTDSSINSEARKSFESRLNTRIRKAVA